MVTECTLIVENSRKFIATIPVRKPLMEEFFVKDLFRWGTGAIMTGCSS